jgi:hypothetical protein
MYFITNKSVNYGLDIIYTLNSIPLPGARNHLNVPEYSCISFQIKFVPCWFVAVFLIQHVILISGFRRDVDEICGLLGYYTASCGNYYHTTPCNNPEDHRFQHVICLEWRACPFIVSESIWSWWNFILNLFLFGEFYFAPSLSFVTPTLQEDETKVC